MHSTRNFGFHFWLICRLQDIRVVVLVVLVLVVVVVGGVTGWLAALRRRIYMSDRQGVQVFQGNTHSLFIGER